MKKIRIAKRLLVMACVALCGVFLNCGDAFAHEMYHNNGIPIAIRWNDVTNRVAKLRINGSNLRSGHSQYYATVRSIWNKSPRASVVHTSFSSSNVDLATATTSYWDIVDVDISGKYVYGSTKLYSSEGRVINAATVETSTKKIGDAYVYYSPYLDRYDDYIKEVMVHEIGHVLGIGHPNDSSYGYNVMDVDSVMRAVPDRHYDELQDHDNSDLDSMY